MVPQTDDKARVAARWVLAIVYVVAGMFHLYTPETFVAIMPGWVPFAHQVVIGTGLCEIAGGIAVPIRALRRAAGIALALYAVCVLPANIKHAVDSLAGGPAALGWWYHAPRLAIQPVLVWWALYAGDVVRWPVGR